MTTSMKNIIIGASASAATWLAPDAVSAIDPGETSNIVTAIVQAIIAVATLFGLFKNRKK